MCILIVKRTGVQFPSVQAIQESCTHNPDGFAMSYYAEGKVNIFRTLDKNEFLAKYRAVSALSYKKVSMIIHARIATHGSVKLENTHCWMDEKTGIVFAHNGILSIANRGDLTDSETFFRDIFIPAYKYAGWDGGERAVKTIIGSSKFAFMDKKGHIYTFGNYINDGGCLFSNTSYQPRTYSYGGSSLPVTSSTAYKKYEFYSSKCYWNPQTSAYVYRGKETDEEWYAKKAAQLKNYMYDYAKGVYVFRTNETDKEWCAKWDAASAAYECLLDEMD